MSAESDHRPVLVAIAGPNGAGKTTFYHAHLAASGLRFLNADVISRELDIDGYEAVRFADALRRELVGKRESFAFETVLSDPVGDKVGFLKQASDSGYDLILCFIGLSGVRQSEERVAMRVTQGGHDVPTEKLEARYPRTMANLKRAIEVLPRVLVYDQSDLLNPFKKVAEFENGRRLFLATPLPAWLKDVLKNTTC
jgi:predicted ABC-type ATPase